MDQPLVIYYLSRIFTLLRVKIKSKNMKLAFNLSWVISTLICCFSCLSKQEKFIQTELNKIEGQWKINSFVMEGSSANSWRSLLKSGEVLFNSCRAKNVKNQNTYCDGDVQINAGIYKISYRFDSFFILRLRAISKDGSGVVAMTEEEAAVTQLLSGNWEIIVKDDTLIAKQLKSNLSSGVFASFTATRK